MDQAQWAATSAVAAILTGVVAVFALWRAIQDSHERTRPIVVPFARVGPMFTHGTLYLVIKNFGPTVAHNIEVSFGEGLASGDVENNKQHIRDQMTSIIRKRYRDPVVMLAPGQSLINTWTNRAMENEYRDSGSVSQSPESGEKLKVKVKYEDRSRKTWISLKRKYVTYEDSVTLYMKDYDWDTKQFPGSANNTEKRIARAIEAVGWETWVDS